MRILGQRRPLAVFAAVAAVAAPLAATVALAPSASAATPTCSDIHVVKHVYRHAVEYMRLPSTSSGATSCLLASGNSGAAVYTLQRSLHYCGYPSLAVDSVFGPDTKKALISAQKKYGADPDGVYGPATRDKIVWAVFSSPAGQGDDHFVDCEKVWTQ